MDGYVRESTDESHVASSFGRVHLYVSRPVAPLLVYIASVKLLCAHPLPTVWGNPQVPTVSCMSPSPWGWGQCARRCRASAGGPPKSCQELLANRRKHGLCQCGTIPSGSDRVRSSVLSATTIRRCVLVRWSAVAELLSQHSTCIAVCLRRQTLNR